MVTTNYDVHLQRQLEEHCDAAIEVFQAPAMPLGDAFEGLVYLHGSAAAAPELLVVTDRDFSKAYFHAAWAARFLERMFSEYVVLFVGYSHTDVVIEVSRTRAWSSSGAVRHHRRPGRPIRERLRDHSSDYEPKQHQMLTQCLTEWADLAEMGLLDHRQRIRSIVSGEVVNPEQKISLITPPGELSNIQDSVRRPWTVSRSSASTNGSRVADWICDEAPFVALFDRTTPWSEASSRLARWFVSRIPRSGTRS